MKVKIEHDVRSLYDALQIVIQFGGVKQTALAEKLEIDKGSFSKKFNNPGGVVANVLNDIEKILQETRQPAFAQFAASLSGHTLAAPEFKDDPDLETPGVHQP